MTIRIAGFGRGRWGNLLFSALEKAGAEVVAFDVDPARGLDPSTFAGRAHMFDAVAITTPAETHYAIALDALRVGKHVLVTKPLTLSGQQARDLADLARKRGLVLMVDHTFLSNAAYRYVHAQIGDCQRIGKVQRIESVRVNHFGSSADVVHDLCPHDLSIWQWWMEGPPERVSLERVGDKAAHIFATYGGIHCHAYVAHDHGPSKVRKMTVMGERGSVQINEDCVTWYRLGRPVEARWFTDGPTALEEEAAEFMLAIRMPDAWWRGTKTRDAVRVVEQIEQALASEGAAKKESA